MTYPTLRAAFSSELPLPATGHAGTMTQPYWVPIGTQGNGFFIVGDESILCAIDRGGQILWQAKARLAFAGYTVDERSIYVIDGYVLLRFDIGLIQRTLTAPILESQGDAERDPQRAFNLITLGLYSLEDGDTTYANIYKLTDATDIANAAKLAKARQRRSWLRMLREAKAEWLKNGERLHAINSAPIPTGTYDLLASRDRQLGSFIDDARWLLGVDQLNSDRSCQLLITRIEAEITQLETEAASLRFSAPVVRRNRELRDIAVFTMAGDGLFMGFSAGFRETMGSKQNPPRSMQIAIEEGADRRTVLSYLSSGGVTSLLLGSNALSVLSTTSPQMTAPQWNDQLTQRLSQLPWKRASIPGKSMEFSINRLTGNGPKGILAVSRDERNDEGIVQLISYSGPVPENAPNPDFTQEPPALMGGKVTRTTADISLPVIAPIVVRNEDDSTFIYALSFSSFAPSPLLGMIDNTQSGATQWERFIGTDSAARGQKRTSVINGTLVPPTAIMRPVSFNKVKLQGNVTDEDWMVKWRAAKSTGATLKAAKDALDKLIADEAKILATIIEKGPTSELYNMVKAWYQINDDPTKTRENFSEFIRMGAIMWKMPENDVEYMIFLPRRLKAARATFAAAETAYNTALAAATSAISSSPLWTAWRTAS